jgi:hypothetical protein
LRYVYQKKRVLLAMGELNFFHFLCNNLIEYETEI